jgi:hypothetical protein
LLFFSVLYSFLSLVSRFGSSSVTFFLHGTASTVTGILQDVNNTGSDTIGGSNASGNAITMPPFNGTYGNSTLCNFTTNATDVANCTYSILGGIASNLTNATGSIGSAVANATFRALESDDTGSNDNDTGVPSDWNGSECILKLVHLKQRT